MTQKCFPKMRMTSIFAVLDIEYLKKGILKRGELFFNPTDKTELEIMSI